MSRRTLVYIGIGVALLVIGRLLTKTNPAPAPAPSDTGAAPTVSAPSASTATRLRRPPNATAEFGVLTDRPEAELRGLVDREAIAAKMTPDLCGDSAACDAVRGAIRDTHATSIDVSATADWEPVHFDLDAAAHDLSAPLRASIAKRAHTVVVHVSTVPAMDALDVRAGFAAAAAVALAIDGLVFDQVLARIESARDFARHAVTEPLGASTFRRDRVQIYYAPETEGVVRVLTAGLLRWGAPDVDAIATPAAASERMSEIVLGVAAALANGLRAGPVKLTREDLQKASGETHPTDAGLEPGASLSVDLTSVHPETGDPNDFYARIEPSGGDGPAGYLDLVERFFGPVLAEEADEDAAATQRERAQRELPEAIARWQRERARGATLRVQLPFPIPGDAGFEDMWVEVERVDARTITGKLLDEPLGATDVARGDEVTRPRAEVSDLQVRGARDE